MKFLKSLVSETKNEVRSFSVYLKYIFTKAPRIDAAVWVWWFGSGIASFAGILILWIVGMANFFRGINPSSLQEIIALALVVYLGILATPQYLITDHNMYFEGFVKDPSFTYK